MIRMFLYEAKQERAKNCSHGQSIKIVRGQTIILLLLIVQLCLRCLLKALL